MARNRPLSLEELTETARVYANHDENAVRAARALGIGRSALIARLERLAREKKEPDYELPEFPDNDIPVEEIIGMMEKRFEKRHAFQRATKWFPVNVKDTKPIGLAFVGDPHVDDDGCNWGQLRTDIEVMRSPGIYATNIGDTTNNWIGRLLGQFAKQETSQETARKLAKWFLKDAGIKWLVWLLGNHDAWGDGSAILREMNVQNVPMMDWQAQYKLVFPNRYECRVWASHDFAGHSMWNSLHGPQKTAHMKESAEIFVCGHKHNWALHQEESAGRDFVYWLARARGYKFIDSYAEKLNHQSQQYGATILAVINPEAKNPAAAVQCFADLEHGADYLKFLRK